MRVLYSTIASIYLFVTVSLFSCTTKGDDPQKADFDRKAMFANIGNNIILPAYQQFVGVTTELDNAIAQFAVNPSPSSLTNARTKFKEAYKAYQFVSLFEFGPAESQLIRANLNTFPVDISQIQANIAAGTYNLATASNLDAKGLPALDYLLFGMDEPATIALYTTDIRAANRKAYLTNLSAEIKSKANTVYNAWSSSGGNYLATFSNSEGNDVGSSLGMLVNQLNLEYEILKNPKIGIPLGKKTLGTPMPQQVEAYYSGLSVELAKLNLQSVVNVYYGRDQQGNNGLGLDDYLVQLQAKYGSTLLADAIQTQFERTGNRLSALPDRLSDAVVNNAAVVNEAYTEIQKGVVLLKTDMASALAVLITYQDNDGD